MDGDLAARLRDLRERRNWTVADMAERTGVPARTLEKYMLRSGASLPGFNGLVALSRGLGVSLDWLVFGSENASEVAELFAQIAAAQASIAHFETILRHLQPAGLGQINGEEILNLTP